MNWQQFLLLVIILAAVVMVVWRGSGKKAGGNCQCGCAHEHDPQDKKAHAERRTT